MPRSTGVQLTAKVGPIFHLSDPTGVALGQARVRRRITHEMMSQ